MQVKVNIDNLKEYFRNATKRRLRDQAQFFNRLSVLMQEGYLFAQSIAILLPHHIDAYKEIQQLVDEQLKQGAGVVGVLEKLQVPKHYLVAITIAENNGHMVEALQGVANQMALIQATKKKLTKLLLYPVSLIVFLLLLFLVFRTIFFPNIENMLSGRSSSTTDNSIALSKALLHLPDVLVLLGIAVICSIISFRLILKNKSVAQQISIMLKIPVYQKYIRVSLTRQFAAYLGSLLQSGFSLQMSLKILGEQELQPFIRHFASRMKERVIFGDTLTQAVSFEATWQKDFAIFVEHGEQSGYLGKELVLYSELLSEKQEQLLQRILSYVQPTFFIIIALCIVAAYVSLLLPIYQMIELV